MNVHYDSNSFITTIEDRDLVDWIDGSKAYYDLPKDYRPQDFNPFDLEDIYQPYYKLERIVGRKTSESLNNELDNLKSLLDFSQKYAFHVLGKIIEEQYKNQPNKETAE